MKHLLIISIILLVSIISTAKQIKIAIIDTGISKEFKGKLCGMEDFTGFGINDVNGHGTIMANLIAHEMVDQDYCFYILKFYHSKFVVTDQTNENSNKAFLKAIELNVDAINFSAAGKEINKEERELIIKALTKGIKIFVPSGNENKDLNKECDIYPACYFSNFFVIGRNDNKGNTGTIVRVKEEGKSGTSMATATTCGKTIRNK